jgi:hypothetical protein
MTRRALRLQSIGGPEGYRFRRTIAGNPVGVNLRRWQVDLDGRRQTVELEHRTWWHRAIVRADGGVVANQSINLAIGYDHAAAVTATIDDHRLDLTIRADGSFRPTYRYALSVDGTPVLGSDEVAPAPSTSARPTLVGVTEQIVWATIVVAALRTLADAPLRAIALIPAAVAASWILRRSDVPPSWRVAGAVLLVVSWVLGSAILTGAYDLPRGF